MNANHSRQSGTCVHVSDSRPVLPFPPEGFSPNIPITFDNTKLGISHTGKRSPAALRLNDAVNPIFFLRVLPGSTPPVVCFGL